MAGVRLLDQALAIRRELKDQAGEGETLFYLGGVYGSAGQYQKAVDYYTQALTVQRAAGDHAGEDDTLTNLADAYARLGRPENALDFRKQILALRQAMKNRTGEASALRDLTIVYAGASQVPGCGRFLRAGHRDSAGTERSGR